MEVEGRFWHHLLVEKKRGSLFEKYPRDKMQGKLLVCFSYHYQNKDLRLFSLFSNYADFYRYQLKFKETDRSFFEVILGENSQKDHFDIEITTEKVEKDKLDQTGNELMYLLLTNIFALYKKEGIELKDDDILIYSSHGPNKRSYHIVVNNYARNGNKECEAFYKLAIENIDPSLSQFIDASVYKSIQQFRILGSQKRESNRPKIMLKEWSFKKGDKEINGSFSLSNLEEENKEAENYFLFEHSLISRVSDCKLLNPLIVKEEKKTFNNVKGEDLKKSDIHKVLDLLALNMGLTRNHYRFPFEFKEAEGRMILLKRKLASFCPICQRIHEHENPFVILGVDGEVWFNCRRCENSKNMGKIESTVTTVEEVTLPVTKAKEEKVEKSVKTYKSLLEKVKNTPVIKQESKRKNKDGFDEEFITGFNFGNVIREKR